MVVWQFAQQVPARLAADYREQKKYTMNNEWQWHVVARSLRTPSHRLQTQIGGLSFNMYVMKASDIAWNECECFVLA